MPPWRTFQLTWRASSPHSWAMIDSASSADWRCCASKSGGTYSASITGVIGSTLSRRTLPPEARTREMAVSIEGLASSVSARSTGTRICLNMCRSPLRLSPALIGRGLQHARHHETLEPPRAGVQLRPVGNGEIDHHQPTGRQLLAQALAILEVARRDELGGGLLQARIVPDDEQRFGRRVGLAKHVDERARRGVVEPLGERRGRGGRR